MLCLSLISLAGCSQDLQWSAVYHMIDTEFPDIRQISTDSLYAEFADSSVTKPVLLDVRTEAEYAVSHLAGALRVDPDDPDWIALDTLSRATPIVTYCSVGYRSSRLADQMAERGFTHVANLKGSMFKWANEGRPVYRAGKLVRAVHPYDKVWGSLLRKDLRAYSP